MVYVRCEISDVRCAMCEEREYTDVQNLKNWAELAVILQKNEKCRVEDNEARYKALLFNFFPQVVTISKLYLKIIQEQRSLTAIAPRTDNSSLQ